MAGRAARAEGGVGAEGEAKEAVLGGRGAVVAGVRVAGLEVGWGRGVGWGTEEGVAWVGAEEKGVWVGVMEGGWRGPAHPRWTHPPSLSRAV